MSLFHKPGPPQWIVAGLGNPGRQYEISRHNAGFLCLDALAAECRCKTDKLKFHALIGLTELGGQRCVLMKPNTYMNRSGEAIAACANFYRIPPECVLVIFDDIALRPGTVRIRRGGSAGGHNGIKSVIRCLGSQEFPRIKLGVGQAPQPDGGLIDWVLGDMPKEELLALRRAADDACGAAALILAGKMEEAMGKYSH
ncbi:MAG: aminoacyl-tRNA hydrolase [Oscillospiraceae bacterium]|jgi:PTH1 family peptidyl-tRNA hydrolase|nr:aminoacyl-tRNA hydrolase [Oscillospiraceae bacterium]